MPLPLLPRRDQHIYTFVQVTLQRGNDPPGVLCKTHWMQATFHHNFNLRYFPFESEQLCIVLHMLGASVPVDIDHGK